MGTEVARVIYSVEKTINGTSWDSRDDFPNDIDVSAFSYLHVFLGVFTITGGTSPTATLIVNSVFPGVTQPYDMFDSGAVPAFTGKYGSIGPGTGAGNCLGTLLRLQMVAAGAPTSVQFQIVVIAR